MNFPPMKREMRRRTKAAKERVKETIPTIDANK